MKNRIAALLEATPGGWAASTVHAPAESLEVRVHRCVLEAIIQHNMREELQRTAANRDPMAFESARQQVRRYEKFLAWLGGMPEGTIQVSLQPREASGPRS